MSKIILRLEHVGATGSKWCLSCTKWSDTPLDVRRLNNIPLILVSVLLNCAAQLAMKKGMMQIGDIQLCAGTLLSALPEMLCNFFLWCSMICYAISILLWMIVLSKVDVSYAYPFPSIGYVVSLCVGYCFFGEHVTITRALGVIIICIGVILISRS